ncbi:hypothetical protein L596_022534 [Steinernema carpocapsae]|uniref:Uncharacterized protein n=1 Tax=Steinernema carpocapsae TaxID=34508 RepID=A0A4U5MMD9_STECR|nr:hypothetical protein L596_022534 [Steinernema carpocapsae]
MLFLFGLFLFGAAIYYPLRYLWELLLVSDLHKKAVFISGCDSGFGRMLALKCVKNGIPVFAGCYTDEGAERLKEEAAGYKGKLETVPLDVMNEESVEKAANMVKEKLTGGLELWAVVNNAGLFSVYGPDDWTSLDEYKLSFDANCLGYIRVTHAFKPLIKKSKGRIIGVTSVAGRVAFSAHGPYCTAKFAAEAYLDIVRQELRPFGVTVSILEPGTFKTTLFNTDAHRQRVEQVWNRLTEEQKAEYGEEYKNNFVEGRLDLIKKIGSARTDYVVDNYYHAITAKYPRCRYRCGWDSLLWFVPISYLPTEILDWIQRSDFATKALTWIQKTDSVTMPPVDMRAKQD